MSSGISTLLGVQAVETLIYYNVQETVSQECVTKVPNFNFEPCI